MIEISHEETPNHLMVYCFEVMIEIKSFFFVFKWLLFFSCAKIWFYFFNLQMFDKNNFNWYNLATKNPTISLSLPKKNGLNQTILGR